MHQVPLPLVPPKCSAAVLGLFGRQILPLFFFSFPKSSTGLMAHGMLKLNCPAHGSRLQVRDSRHTSTVGRCHQWGAHMVGCARWPPREAHTRAPGPGAQVVQIDQGRIGGPSTVLLPPRTPPSPLARPLRPSPPSDCPEPRGAGVQGWVATFACLCAKVYAAAAV